MLQKVTGAQMVHSFLIAVVRFSRRTCSRFRRHESGNLSLILGITLFAIAACVGAAVDLERTLDVKTNFDAFADSSVLMAVNQTSGAISTTTAQAAGLNAFQKMSQQQSWVTVQSTQLAITDNAGVRTGLLNYTATIPATFMSLFGQQTLTVVGSSTAQSAGPNYTDVYILVDNSSSMALGATTNDINLMQALTPDQCAFACHETDKSGTDYYSIARKNNVLLRIDSVRNAVQQVITLAKQTSASSPSQFRFALYTFGTDMQSMALKSVFSLSNDLSGALTAASGINLMTVPYQNYNNDQGTDFPPMLTGLNSAIPSQGDGSSWSSTKKLVFFISDGLNDHGSSPCSGVAIGYRCEEPLDASNCLNMKNRGITVAAIYTTYLPVPTNSWYMSTVSPYNAGPYSPSPNSKIEQGMSNCASSGYFQEVGPNDDLSGTISNLFLKAISTVRLTN